MKNNWLRMMVALCCVTGLLAFAALAVAQDAAAPSPTPAGHTYVGSKACKTCHAGESHGKIFETWLGTKHANAMAVLDSAKGERKDEKCVRCHTTGFGTDSGFKLGGDMDPMNLASVGCEACHGPGSDYKKMTVMKDKKAALAAGLIVPNEETCKKCHNEQSPTFKGFDFKAMYPKIEHHLPKAAATEGAK